MKLEVVELDVKDGRWPVVCVAASPEDATRLNEFFEWARKADEERDELREKLDDANGLLKNIGDFAHERSAGPAVTDDLWEVRRMAYDL
jgi:hypothetical protein